MILNALYLCSEQSDNLGEDQLAQLKRNVMWLPKLDEINISYDDLLECSHNSWEYEYTSEKKAQEKRKKILKRTVNKIFDFGTINNLFGTNSGKCNSIAALVYYSHILSDYIADDPDSSEITTSGYSVSAYSGESYTEINGNIPQFSNVQKKNTEDYASFSQLDSSNRCGVAIALLGPKTLSSSDSRENISHIYPSGWQQSIYSDQISTGNIYNRCHLIGHQLYGNDSENNLITGTRYMNESGMKPFEDQIADYIKETENHVIYRVTPVFVENNLVASGVQMEAYSIEDNGEGICFNVYCYNVQPGININYATGVNESADNLYDSDYALPFAVLNPGESNPDLMYEVEKHMEIIFDDQKNSFTYTLMLNSLDAIASDARVVGDRNETETQQYQELKGYEYEYLETLSEYVPQLLQKEDFFTSAFH
jgi:hypothetical protein